MISASGTLAQLAAEKLEAAGLNNCAVVEGGMQGWERNGLPVDRSRHLRAWLTEHRKRMIDTGVVTDVEEIYDRHTYLPQMKVAMENFESRLKTIVESA